MFNPSFKEDHSSQLPALQLLINMNYTYLPPEEALLLRGDKTSQVLLEDVLRKQLQEINSIRVSSTKTTLFSDANIEAGIIALKELPVNEGFLAASETAYNLLTLGKTLEQSIDGDKKSFTLRYIDWEYPERNVFHVTEEYGVMRSGRKDHYYPDIVLFINGIPVTIIECKRPDMKEPLAQAISQHIRNQQQDGIRPLYLYSQLLLSVACLQARYATTDTKEEFWATWKEETATDELQNLVNLPLPERDKKKLYSSREEWEIRFMEEREKTVVSVSVQDQYLYWLCQPQRLLELIKDYIIFEGGKYKKIARYQQYFSIKKTIDRILHFENGRRQGGVIWHTQGSGKSLTMAMLARKIYQTVLNPKIILVTDRVDLDTQITATFSRVDVHVDNAKTGSHLVELLRSKSDRVITTIINKFEAAVNQMSANPLESNNIFVLIDEGHRTQYGTFNVKMQKVLPNACFLAFTGTPLMRKEKSTAQKFGGIIDAYTILQAVEDGAIVPIVYEGRHAVQDVNQQALDKGFDYVSEALPRYQKADLKRKYSKANLIGKTEQRIDEIARDISDHYAQTWGEDATGERSGFKGMAVTPDKLTAVKYKKAFDLIGKVTTEVLMSPPDDREGNEDIHEEAADEVVKFWRNMEAKHGKNFEEGLINQFKKSDHPDLLIVVDKLLTGFDEPRVIVMYLCRKLKEHTLLQAIARVNRVAPGKEFGYIIDYEGIIGELDEALNLYTSLADFEPEDLEGTFVDIRKEIDKLPQAHEVLKNIFKNISNKADLVGYVSLLADEAIRTEFYQKFTAFARLLKMALSSIEYENNTPEKAKNLYLKDLRFFTNLRNAVVNTYSDRIDFKKYEKQLQKLLDQHVTTEGIIRMTEQVSILDAEAFERELEKVGGKRAQAEMIASRTTKHITERMDEDPVFYKKLSELIKQTISDLRAMRLSEAEALKKLKEYRQQAVTKKGDDVPSLLEGKENAVAFYRLFQAATHLSAEEGVAFTQEVEAIIQKFKVVDWQSKLDVIRKMNFFIGEYLIDHLKMPIKKAEALAEHCLDVAKVRYRQ